MRIESSPSRGTWIEIWVSLPHNVTIGSRPPHGGRGLKYEMNQSWQEVFESSPSRGTWIEISWSIRPEREKDGRPPHGGRGLK